MRYNYEYDQKLRVGYIGAGEHSYRTILPALQYAPVELVALTDHNTQRGLAVARQFGARRFYPNHKALLNKEEDLDAIMIVVGPDAEGKPRYPELASEALVAGFHTWIDTPPCFSADDVSTYTDACIKSHKYVAAGFHRRFAPAYQKAAELMQERAFGRASSFAMRYPLVLPAEDERQDDATMAGFLPFVGVYALLVGLFGEAQSFSFARSGTAGGAVFSFAYSNGLVGSLHLTGGQAPSGPVERLEIVGSGANLIVDEGVRLTYYRPEAALSAELVGREDSYLGSAEHAPVIWQPRFTPDEISSRHSFLQGYAGAVQHFAEQLLAKEPPKHGTLVEILHVMTVFDAIREGQEREWIRI